MDTGGQERFNSIVSNYYKIADCCLLVYDITCKKSFEKIKDYYIDKLKENCSKIVKIILLGNKTDLSEKREVSSKEGADLAEKNGYIFMESSCVDNYNVSNAFETLIQITNTELEKNNSRKLKIKPMNNKKKDKDKDKGKCC
jgi:small GTP-binding protein